MVASASRTQLEELRRESFTCAPSHSTRLTHDELVDRIRGVFFGAALGGAIGLATRDMTREQVIEVYGEGTTMTTTTTTTPTATATATAKTEAVTTTTIIAANHESAETKEENERGQEAVIKAELGAAAAAVATADGLQRHGKVLESCGSAAAGAAAVAARVNPPVQFGLAPGVTFKRISPAQLARREGDTCVDVEQMLLAVATMLATSGDTDAPDLAQRIAAWARAMMPGQPGSGAVTATDTFGSTNATTTTNNNKSIPSSVAFEEIRMLSRISIDSTSSSTDPEENKGQQQQQQQQRQRQRQRQSTASSLSRPSIISIFTPTRRSSLPYYPLGTLLSLCLGHAGFLTDPHEAAHEVAHELGQTATAGNGALLRTVIFGLPYFWNAQRVRSAALDVCKVTHADARCQMSGVVLALTISRMLQGDDLRRDLLIETAENDVFTAVDSRGAGEPSLQATCVRVPRAKYGHGFGVAVKNGRTVVQRIDSDAPVAKTVLSIGDTIEAINGAPCDGLTMIQVVKLMKKQRRGSGYLTLTLAKQEGVEKLVEKDENKKEKLFLASSAPGKKEEEEGKKKEMRGSSADKNGSIKIPGKAKPLDLSVGSSSSSSCGSGGGGGGGGGGDGSGSGSGGSNSCVGGGLVGLGINDMSNNENDLADLHPYLVPELARHLAPPSLEPLHLDEPGTEGYVLKCMGAGVIAATRAAHSTLALEVDAATRFKDAIWSVACEGGHADANSALCGVLLGADMGYSGLPRDWLSGLRDYERLWRASDRVCALLGLLGAPRDGSTSSITRHRVRGRSRVSIV